MTGVRHSRSLLRDAVYDWCNHCTVSHLPAGIGQRDQQCTCVMCILSVCSQSLIYSSWGRLARLFTLCQEQELDLVSSTLVQPPSWNILPTFMTLLTPVHSGNDSRVYFWPTVLSVEPLVHCVVCLSSICNVLYCCETVRPSEKLSEGVNKKPGSKSLFWGVAAIFLLPVSPLRPPGRPFLTYFCQYSPAIGTRW